MINAAAQKATGGADKSPFGALLKPNEIIVA
jgi:hypothetical protein